MAQTYLQALASDARCFSCLTGQTKTQVQAYIVAFTTGLGVDPAAWAIRVKCLNCLTLPELLQVRIYLLATLAGFTTDAASLVRAATCYACFEHGEIATIQTYLLAQDPAGPGITSPQALAQVVSGFRKFNAKTLLQIEVFALATNAGLSTDPSALLAVAKCMPCVPFPLLAAVALEVIDFLEPIPADSPRVSLPPPPPPPAPGGGPPPGRGGGIPGCQDNLTLLIPVVTAHYTLGLITTIDILFPKVCCKPGTYQVYGSNAADMSGPALVASGNTGGSHGQANVTVSGIDISAAGFAFYAVKQVCKNGLPVSAYSNIVPAVNSGDTWAQRVVLNGGAMPSTPTIDAINTFVSTLNGAGVWSKMLHVNVFAPDSLIAAETPLIKTLGTRDPYTVNTGSPGISVNGVLFAPVGSFNIGIIPLTDLSLTNQGVSWYASTGIDVNHYEFGSFNVGTGNAIFMRWAFTGATKGAYTNGNGGSGTISNGTPIAGFHSWNRVANNNFKLYRASSTHPFAQDGSDAVANPNGLPTSEFTVGGCNIDGVTSNTSNRFSFFAVHQGLNATDAQALYNAVQALRTAFGGGFV